MIISPEERSNQAAAHVKGDLDNLTQVFPQSLKLGSVVYQKPVQSFQQRCCQNYSPSCNLVTAFCTSCNFQTCLKKSHKQGTLQQSNWVVYELSQPIYHDPGTTTTVISKEAGRRHSYPLKPLEQQWIQGSPTLLTYFLPTRRTSIFQAQFFGHPLAHHSTQAPVHLRSHTELRWYRETELDIMTQHFQVPL